jgi:hypothetical protein
MSNEERIPAWVKLLEGIASEAKARKLKRLGKPLSKA